MNQKQWQKKFIREGYEVVDFSEIADVYVINTCTVTNMGDKKIKTDYK